MNITLLSTQVQNNTVPISSMDLFASTHHLESIPSFFLGLTALASDYEKRDKVMLNCGDGKIRVGVEPGFFADSSSYILLQVTRLSKRLMFICPRREEVLWCRIPLSDVGFPVSFLSYRLRNRRDGSRSDVVVNLRVELGRWSKEMKDLLHETAPCGRIGRSTYRQPLGSVTGHGAVIGIPEIEQTKPGSSTKMANILEVCRLKSILNGF